MVFEPDQSLPAAGQGALGIEVRADRTDLLEALAPLIHWPTWYRVAAERTVSRAMGGSCSMPLAAYSDWDAGSPEQLRLDAAWGDPEGRSPLVRVGAQSDVTSLAQAEALGLRVTQALQAAGAPSPLQD
jgi:hydroxymethylbilane synthase